MPCPPEYIDDYADLVRRLDIPLALDSVANRYRALEFLRRRALGVSAARCLSRWRHHRNDADRRIG